MGRDLPNLNVFVFSLPRCGSSLMVRVLEQLGANMVHTSEEPQAREQRDRQHKARFGEFEMNPQFCEIGRGRQLECYQEILAAPFSGCKFILPACLSGIPWQVVTQQPAKVLLMWRDPAEIWDSQQRCYIRVRAPQLCVEDEQEQASVQRAYYATTLAQAELQLRDQRDRSNEVRFGRGEARPFDFLKVKFRELTGEKHETRVQTVQRIAQFINAPVGPWNAIEEVDPALVRCKKEEAENGQ